MNHTPASSPPRTIHEDFQHFLSYSNLGTQPPAVLGMLFKAFEAAWEPARHAAPSGEAGALHGKLGLFAKEHFNINDNLPTPETFERLGMWITALKGQRDTLRKELLRFRIAVAEATGWEHVCPPEEDGGRDFWQFRENHDQKIDEPKDLPDCCDELEGQWEHMVSQGTRLTELTAALARKDDKSADYWRGYAARVDEAFTELPEPNNPTLWRYLQNAFEKKIAFHAVGVSRMPDGGFHFYIHPQSVSGETEDYLIWPDPFSHEDILVNKKDSPPPDVEKFKAFLAKQRALTPSPGTTKDKPANEGERK